MVGLGGGGAPEIDRVSRQVENLDHIRRAALEVDRWLRPVAREDLVDHDRLSERLTSGKKREEDNAQCSRSPPQQSLRLEATWTDSY